MRITEIEIKLRAKERLNLPPYKGSAIRGAFGIAFRKICCPFTDKDCPECLLKDKCVYSYVFETPRPVGSKIMRKYENVPHPFVIEPPLDTTTEFNPGDPLSFKLILFGKAIDFLPYFIYSFEQMVERGLGKPRTFNPEFESDVTQLTGKVRGKGRGKLELLSVNQGRNIIYDGVSKNLKSGVKERELKIQKSRKPVNLIKLIFLTPLRIIYQGKIAQSLDFHILARSLLRRIGLLSYFHSEEPFVIDFPGLINKATKVRTKSAAFQIQDWTRYSSRQEQKIPMNGLIGEATYQGNLTEFIPYLKIGEKVHIGKGTAFGLGKFKVKILY